MFLEAGVWGLVGRAGVGTTGEITHYGVVGWWLGGRGGGLACRGLIVLFPGRRRGYTLGGQFGVVVVFLNTGVGVFNHRGAGRCSGW